MGGTAAVAMPGRALALPGLGRNWRGLHGLDLVVDLGCDIGTRGWWRGLATVGLLCAAVAWSGWGVKPITALVTAPLTPAQTMEAAPLAIAPAIADNATGRRMAATARVRPLSSTPERPRLEVSATMQGRDIATTLRRAGVGASDVGAATALIAQAIDPRRLRSGTALNIVLGRRDSLDVPRPLDNLGFRAAFDLRLELYRQDGALRLRKVPIAVDDTPLRITGRVGSSLYKSARAAGLPASLVADVIKALSYGLDFQRDVVASDKFDIVVEHRRAETGEVEVGKLLYAGLDKGRRKVQMLRWTLNGRDQFFDAAGEATKKGLMRTPVDGARISSPFGLRRHPVLGFSRMHKGIDFAVARGTPIMAAAGGRVVFAGWHGGHGNYVMVDHGNGLRTAYGHMSKIAAKVGQRINQGQTLGYVGSTGLSTGPHLHYELWRNGQAVDPRSVKFTSRMQLAGRDLSAFKARLARLLSVRASSGETRTASDETAARRTPEAG